MTKNYCDKCKAELPPDMKKNVKIGMWVHCIPTDKVNAYGQTEYDSYKVFYYDICNDCCETLIETITGEKPGE